MRYSKFAHDGEKIAAVCNYYRNTVIWQTLQSFEYRFYRNVAFASICNFLAVDCRANSGHLNYLKAFSHCQRLRSIKIPLIVRYINMGDLH